MKQQRWFEYYEYRIYEPVREGSGLATFVDVQYRGPNHQLSYFHYNRAKYVSRMLNFLIKVGIDVPHM